MQLGHRSECAFKLSLLCLEESSSSKELTADGSERIPDALPGV